MQSIKKYWLPIVFLSLAFAGCKGATICRCYTGTKYDTTFDFGKVDDGGLRCRAIQLQRGDTCMAEEIKP